LVNKHLQTAVCTALVPAKRLPNNVNTQLSSGVTI